MRIETMELRIRNLDEETHAVAKIAAARKRASLNQFVIDAIRAAVKLAAKTDDVINRIVKEKK